jgi:hypothetical protein
LAVQRGRSAQARQASGLQTLWASGEA